MNEKNLQDVLTVLRQLVKSNRPAYRDYLGEEAQDESVWQEVYREDRRVEGLFTGGYVPRVGDMLTVVVNGESGEYPLEAAPIFADSIGGDAWWFGSISYATVASILESADPEAEAAKYVDNWGGVALQSGGVWGAVMFFGGKYLDAAVDVRRVTTVAKYDIKKLPVECLPDETTGAISKAQTTADKAYYRAGTQADWNQNDTAADSYIRNRPCYTEFLSDAVTQIVWDDNTEALDQAGPFRKISDLVLSLEQLVGAVYSTKNKEYTLVAPGGEWEGNNYVLFEDAYGAYHMADVGPYFASGPGYGPGAVWGGFIPSAGIWVLRDHGPCRLDNLATAEVVHKLDNKYLNFNPTKLETKQTKLETKQTKLETKQTELETKQTELETKQTGLETKQTGLETKQTELETKLEMEKGGQNSPLDLVYVWNGDTTLPSCTVNNPYDRGAVKYYQVSNNDVPVALLNAAKQVVMRPADGDDSYGGMELSILDRYNHCTTGSFIAGAMNTFVPVCFVHEVTDSDILSFPSVGVWISEPDGFSISLGGGILTIKGGIGTYLAKIGTELADLTYNSDNTDKTEFYLKSSTAESIKRFKITVDDTGALTATEVVE